MPVCPSRQFCQFVMFLPRELAMVPLRSGPPSQTSGEKHFCSVQPGTRYSSWVPDKGKRYIIPTSALVGQPLEPNPGDAKTLQFLASSPPPEETPFSLKLLSSQRLDVDSPSCLVGLQSEPPLSHRARVGTASISGRTCRCHSSFQSEDRPHCTVLVQKVRIGVQSLEFLR